MKKFIVIIVAMLVSMSAYCQIVSKVPADERQKVQWINAQKEIRVGKTMMWTSVAVASITTGVSLIVMNNNLHQSEVSPYWREVTYPDGRVDSITYESLNKGIKTAMICVDIGCAAAALFGIYKQINGRHKLDKLYFNGGGVTWVYEF